MTKEKKKRKIVSGFGTMTKTRTKKLVFLERRGVKEEKKEKLVLVRQKRRGKNSLTVEWWLVLWLVQFFFSSKER